MARRSYNIGIFICGLGNDGVSHEALKKRLVFEAMGHNVTIITGTKGEYLPENGIVVEPDLCFFSSINTGLEVTCFPYNLNSPAFDDTPKKKRLARDFVQRLKRKGIELPASLAAVEHNIMACAAGLEQKLRRLTRKLKLDLVVVENIFAIPMHIPAAVAIADTIKETRLPAIAIHHDFYWERDRYDKGTITGILSKYFPPSYNNLRHVVINSSAQRDLKDPSLIDPSFGARPRKPLKSVVLPNFFNFDFTPGLIRHTHTLIPSYPRVDSYNCTFLDDLGFDKKDVLLLQHSRIVERKNIERSVDLLVELRNARKRRASRYKLVISCKSLDEGNDYYERLVEYIASCGLTIGHCHRDGTNEQGDVVFIGDRIAEGRASGNGAKVYHYLDPYPFCDFVTYPSTYEGWGNSIGEAVQAGKPVLVNRYPIYDTDLKHLGFKFVEMNGKITPAIVKKVLRLLEDKEYAAKQAEHNFAVGKKQIGYDCAEKTFEKLFRSLKPHIDAYRGPKK